MLRSVQRVARLERSTSFSPIPPGIDVHRGTVDRLGHWLNQVSDGSVPGRWSNSLTLLTDAADTSVLDK